MKMKDLNPRIHCANGVSLSVQANRYAYCSPRIDEIDKWNQYSSVEVGYIYDTEKKEVTPPSTWAQYADGEFPSSVYGYIPVRLVEEFIESNGGQIEQQ